MIKMNDKDWKTRCKNEFMLLQGLVKPGICEIHPADSSFTRGLVTLYVPSYIVPQIKGGEPVLAHKHELVVEFPRCYPYVKPIVRFKDISKRFAHCNVWPSGDFCIGDWVKEPKKNTDSILGVLQRCIEAGSFCSRQFNMGSQTTDEWNDFYRKKKAAGDFPLYKLWWLEPEKKRIILREVGGK